MAKILVRMAAMMGVVTCGMALTAQTTQAPASERTRLPTAQAPAAAPGSPQSNAATAEAAQAPTAQTGPIQFPAVDPKNFKAASPTPATVDSFLHAVWGIDENREWRVAAIQPASVPGFVKVDVLVADKRQPTRIGSYVFLITPDGKHAVQGDLAPFGAHPFSDNETLLQQRADGPARGAAGKELELVEFTDLQCAACKAARSTLDQIVQDFPQAHIVVQPMPLPAQHPFALQAAEVGVCVRQAKGDPAFFVYEGKVFDTQADLVTGKADATLKAAVTAAGADPATVMACAAAPATRATVEASVKLATDLGIAGTPTLVINGRVLPMAQVPYPTLKRVIAYQGQLDGLVLREQPSLTTLK